MGAEALWGWRPGCPRIPEDLLCPQPPAPGASRGGLTGVHGELEAGTPCVQCATTAGCSVTRTRAAEPPKPALVLEVGGRKATTGRSPNSLMYCEPRALLGRPAVGFHHFQLLRRCLLLMFLSPASGIAGINLELCSPQASLPSFFLFKALEYNLVRAKFLRGFFV